jgi:hypothetical protein
MLSNNMLPHMRRTYCSRSQVSTEYLPNPVPAIVLAEYADKVQGGKSSCHTIRYELPPNPFTDRFIFGKDVPMSIQIDEAIEDARSVLLAGKKYAAELNENGASAEDLAALESQIAIVLGQTVGQKKAKTDARGATNEQNNAVARSRRWIKRVKLMAVSAFRKDKQMLSVFHTDQPIPKTVKSLAVELRYIKDTAVANKEKLAKKGLKDADIEKCTDLEAELSGNDVEQENKKRTGTVATKQRNAAVEAMNTMVDDIRISAKLAFAEDDSKLNEFKTLYPHRASKKAADETKTDSAPGIRTASSSSPSAAPAQ